MLVPFNIPFSFSSAEGQGLGISPGMLRMRALRPGFMLNMAGKSPNEMEVPMVEICYPLVI